MCLVVDYDLYWIFVSTTSFVALPFTLLLEFIYLDLKHVFHYLNVANKWKIYEPISSRNHSPCFSIQKNLQKLYFSP